jgi:hypothetical protein
MSANGTNRYTRTNPNTTQNSLWNFKGTVAGYASGGPPGTGGAGTIDKFPFATDANATDVGSLSVSRGSVAGQSSYVDGYTSGGYTTTPPFTYHNVIDKFPFASNSNATDVGDLTTIRYGIAGQSSEVSGYSSGGVREPPVTPPTSNIIDKFPFATNTNATDVGDLTLGRRFVSGQSSDVSGYTSGGLRAPQVTPPIPAFFVNEIDKFPFATDANATDVGDLTILSAGQTGQSSNVSGYNSGGYGRFPLSPSSPITAKNTIDKFPFASDASATDVGDLTVVRQRAAGQSSTVRGYTAGGFTPPATFNNVIDKFPFASNSNATDVGDLTTTMYDIAGQQD